MKVYNLCCEHEHRFEGWFVSEEEFHSQAERGLIECPLCDSRLIERMPSAPRLNLGKGSDAATKEPGPDTQQQIAWLEMVRQVMAQTEDVGEKFADEARRIHFKEAPERGIRGIATNEEREALAEEGIEVAVLPMPAAFKLPVQ